MQKISEPESDKSGFSEKAEKHLLNYNWGNAANQYLDFYFKNLE